MYEPINIKSINHIFSFIFASSISFRNLLLSEALKGFFSVSDIFSSYSALLTKLLTSGILFLRSLRAAVIAKLVMLGFLSSISMINDL